MIVYVLHDLRRPDHEWDACYNELVRQGIKDYQLIPATVDKETVPASINYSHKQMVALAKFHNLPEVCILESDVRFPAPAAWKYFLDNMPKKYHLYLGGCYSQNMNYFRLRRKEQSYPIIPVTFVTGLHCYIIHSSYYDIFLSSPDDMHIDVAQVQGTFKVIYPFAAIQRKGWSANAKREDVDYNTDLLPEDVYGWNAQKKGPDESEP